MADGISKKMKSYILFFAPDGNGKPFERKCIFS
jgi:hypothetical protein